MVIIRGKRLPDQTWLPFAALAVAMFSFQCGASLAKQIFPTVGAEGATALRIGLAAIILVPIMRPWRISLSWRSIPGLLGYGAALGCMNLCFYFALKTVPLGMVVTLEFTGPLLVALLNSRRIQDLFCLILAAAGLLLLSPLHHPATMLEPHGVVLALGAGACWALYIIFGQQVGREHGAAVTAVGMAVAAAIAVPIGIAHAGARLLAPHILFFGLGVAVLSSALPYSLEMLTLTRLPVRTYGVLTSAEPAIAAFTGLVLLHEAIEGRQLLAIALVMLASTCAAVIHTTETIAPSPV